MKKSKLVSFFENRIEELKKELAKNTSKNIRLHLIENSIMINEKLLEQIKKSELLGSKSSHKFH